MARPCDSRVIVLLSINEIAEAALFNFKACVTLTRPYDNSIGMLLLINEIAKVAFHNFEA